MRGSALGVTHNVTSQLTMATPRWDALSKTRGVMHASSQTRTSVCDVWNNAAAVTASVIDAIAPRYSSSGCRLATRCSFSASEMRA